MNEPLKPVSSPETGSLELVSEVADLAVGAGMLTLILAPFALPGLALIALTTVALLIPGYETVRHDFVLRGGPGA